MASDKCTIERKKGKRSWRCRWWVNGERDQGSWSNDLSVVEAEERRVNEWLASIKPMTGKRVWPWETVKAKWLETLEGRYQEESRRALARYTDGWGSTASATVEAMGKVSIGAARAIRACVRWAWLTHDQPMDARAMKVEPKRKRAKKAQPELTSDERAFECINEAAEWSAGSAAMCHVIALYSPRAESLVGLTGEAFDGDSLNFTNKNGEPERQILAPWTIAIIKALNPAKGKPLFLSHLTTTDKAGEMHVRPWRSGQEFSAWFHHQIGKGVGWKVLLRCSSMTRLLELSEGNAKRASGVSKHKTPSLIPNTYAHTTRQQERELVGKVAERLAPFAAPRIVEQAQ